MDAVSPSQGLHTSPQARARTRRRYRREWRLKFYGLLAIALAAGALLFLLSSILGRAVLVIKQAQLRIPVNLEQRKIDPKASGDPEILRTANYLGLLKKALRKAFPEVKGRRAKRELYRLISDVSEFELRDLVLENPGLIGKTVDVTLLASDDVDLYLKGQMGRLWPLATGNEIARPSGTRGEISIALKGPAVRQALAAIKAALAQQAAVLRRQAVDQARAMQVMDQRLAQAKSEPERARLQRQKQGYERKYQRLEKQIAALMARVKNITGEEELSPALPSLLLKIHGGFIKVTRIAPDQLTGVTIIPLQSAQPTQHWELNLIKVPEEDRKLSDRQIVWVEKLREQGRAYLAWNWRFLTASDSSTPEAAGIYGALLGTFWTMLVTFVLSFPLGVLAAIYLEEFAPQNALTRFIEVNINNLAAVPSIIFGLLGLVVFINIFGLGYSTPLVGGMVLALMTLPTIIIASRAALKAVPPSIREAALGVGASKTQMVFHHVLPLAMPGILTGSIIGMAQALGETAPLLMIGMVAFVADPPLGVNDSAAVLPVQIFIWANNSEAAFDMRTAGAIVVLLLFLIAMNLVAILLRKRFERRW